MTYCSGESGHHRGVHDNDDSGSFLYLWPPSCFYLISLDYFIRFSVHVDDELTLKVSTFFYFCRSTAC